MSIENENQDADEITEKPPVEKKKGAIEKPKRVGPPVYRLNFRRPNGDIRSDIPKSLVHTLVTEWCDLLRLIPSNRWSTMDEIAIWVWEWETRNYRQKYNRTRPQIERGVIELVEAGVVLSKP